MFFDWSKSEEIDWSGRSGPLITEKDYENSVIKRILQNKYAAPFCERQYVHVTPWWNPQDPIDKTAPNVRPHDKGSKRRNKFIPGLHPVPSYPQLSTLSKEQHLLVLRVLNAKHANVQPRGFPNPSQKDYEDYEEIKEVYEIEQKEFIKWAKHLWIMGDCIRALRPKPTLERVYDANFRTRANEMQSLPQNYTLAAQIPLETKNSDFHLEFKQDLINVNLEVLPEVKYPEEMTEAFSIMRECPLPEPCIEHPCRFILPHEATVSVLPLPEIHRELGQYAVENGASVIASEDALSCLLQTDRSWKIPVSVVVVITPDGDMKNAIVLGSEFSVQKECATHRTYKAYKHLLHHTFAPATTDQYKKTSTRQSKPQEPNHHNDFESLNDDLNVSSDDDDANKLLIDDRTTVKTEAMDINDTENETNDETDEPNTDARARDYRNEPIQIDLYEVVKDKVFNMSTESINNLDFEENHQTGMCEETTDANCKLINDDDTGINELGQIINLPQKNKMNSTRESRKNSKSCSYDNIDKTKQQVHATTELNNESSVILNKSKENKTSKKDNRSYSNIDYFVPHNKCPKETQSRRLSDSSDNSDYSIDENVIHVLHFMETENTDSEKETEIETTVNNNTNVSQPLNEANVIAQPETSQRVESETDCQTRTLRLNELETGESNSQESIEECYQTSRLSTNNISALSRDAIDEIIGVHSCDCKGTPFEVPPPRSYQRWQVRSSASQTFDVIVHSSHRARKGTKEVILEPIVEYQPELGGARQSRGRVRALSLALMLRPAATLINVRVDHENGHVIVVDETSGEQFSERHGDHRADVANVMHTACDQLRFLMPGHYVLAHDSCHGAHAMLYSTKGSFRADAVPLSLRAEHVNMVDAEDARQTKIPPELGPTLLPYHKHRAILPLAFTPYPLQLRTQDKKAAAALARAKQPPSALQWPKKKKKSKPSRLNRPTRVTE